MHALPSDYVINDIFRYETAAQKKFDWALQKLLESQQRRQKAQAPVSVQLLSDQQTCTGQLGRPSALKSQFATSNRGRIRRRYLPFVFTQHAPSWLPACALRTASPWLDHLQPSYWGKVAFVECGYVTAAF